jgi:hypothetical protein
MDPASSSESPLLDSEMEPVPRRLNFRRELMGSSFSLGFVDGAVEAGREMRSE